MKKTIKLILPVVGIFAITGFGLNQWAILFHKAAQAHLVQNFLWLEQRLVLLEFLGAVVAILLLFGWLIGKLRNWLLSCLE